MLSTEPPFALRAAVRWLTLRVSELRFATVPSLATTLPDFTPFAFG
jgi:hypothetical protein